MFEFKESNAIYQNLDQEQERFKKDNGIEFFRINGLDIPFSSRWRKIAVNLSGGADSCCLAMLLCKIIQDNNFDCKINVITHVRCWTTRPWQQPISVEVFTELKKLYPDIIQERYENFITPEIEHGVTGYIYKDPTFNEDHSGDQLQVAGFNRYCGHRNNIDAIFNATSANPPGTDFPKKMKDREKLASDGVITDLFLSNQDVIICCPFKFVDKSWILAQYYYFDKLNLLTITRSCEGDVTHKKISPTVSHYKEYYPGKQVPECGSCFWCLERSWAFDNVDSVLEKLKNV